MNDKMPGCFRLAHPPVPVPPLAVVVANNMIMEAETAHVLQTCQMLAAFAATGRRVSYVWPHFGCTVPLLADAPIDPRPLACFARYGAARYGEFSLRLTAALSGRALRGQPVITRSLGVALAAQAVAPRVVLELHQDLSRTARLSLPLLGPRVRLVTISGALRQHLIEAYGIAPERVIDCHDGVDYQRFAEAQPLPPDQRLRPQTCGPLVHLYYGTLRTERGLGMIRHAARALPEHGFVLVGGSAEVAAAARADGLDLPNVHVEPALPHARIPALVRSYASVLLPYTRAVTTWRWMSPLKLFEVLAAGTPAVVSALGPVTEVVGPEHATLIDPDDPETLVAALRALERDPSAARARARAGQAMVAERYTWLARAEAMARFAAL
ncbi:putative Glycosyltransferase family 4 protein [uncultured Gammaproteobacteria bacterium]